MWTAHWNICVGHSQLCSDLLTVWFLVEVCACFCFPHWHCQCHKMEKRLYCCSTIQLWLKQKSSYILINQVKDCSTLLAQRKCHHNWLPKPTNSARIKLSADMKLSYSRKCFFFIYSQEMTLRLIKDPFFTITTEERHIKLSSGVL